MKFKFPRLPRGVRIRVGFPGEINAEVSHKIEAMLAHFRVVADDPDRTEGTLRDHLRQSAQLAQSLQRSALTQSKLIRRLGWNFMILSVMFGLLSGWLVADLFDLHSF